jgi:hypothetical protein
MKRRERVCSAAVTINNSGRKSSLEIITESMLLIKNADFYEVFILWVAVYGGYITLVILYGKDLKRNLSLLSKSAEIAP